MLNTAIFSRVRTAAGRFARADQGNIAVLFAIAAVPILSFVGAAIDYTRANSARSSMQAALDSTALMVAKDLSDGTIKASDINTKAQDYFKALYTNTEAKERERHCDLYGQHRPGLDHQGQRLRQRADRVHEGRRLPANRLRHQFHLGSGATSGCGSRSRSTSPDR